MLKTQVQYRAVVNRYENASVSRYIVCSFLCSIFSRDVFRKSHVLRPSHAAFSTNNSEEIRHTRHIRHKRQTYTNVTFYSFININEKTHVPRILQTNYTRDSIEVFIAWEFLWIIGFGIWLNLCVDFFFRK